MGCPRRGRGGGGGGGGREGVNHLTQVLLVLGVKLLLDFALHLIHPVVHLLICGAHFIPSRTFSSAGHKCQHFLQNLVLHLACAVAHPHAFRSHRLTQAQCSALGVEM